jgi:hypothetical protein
MLLPEVRNVGVFLCRIGLACIGKIAQRSGSPIIGNGRENDDVKLNQRSQGELDSYIDELFENCSVKIFRSVCNGEP